MWEVFEDAPYSRHLAPNNYHLFHHLKKFLTAHCLRNDQETKDIVYDWLKGLVATFFNKYIQKLV
jgi:hypothetical protein